MDTDKHGCRKVRRALRSGCPPVTKRCVFWTVGKSRVYPCSSVSIRGFKSVLLNRSGSGHKNFVSHPNFPNAACLYCFFLLNPLCSKASKSSARKDEQTMVSIVSSYPGFHALPRGIKQLLLTSETHFFNEATASTTLHSTPAVPAPPPLYPPFARNVRRHLGRRDRYPLAAACDSGSQADRPSDPTL